MEWATHLFYMSWPDQNPGLSLIVLAALTFHWGGQGGDARLRVTEVHLLVQAAQRVEGGVCVLLDKQVPGIDLVDHDDFHSDTIRQHELEEEEAANTVSVLLMFGIHPEDPGPVCGLTQPWHPESRGLLAAVL